MPAAFDRCVKGGGRVRTKTLSGGRYMHVCFKGGKSYAGYVKKKGSGVERGSEKKAAKQFKRD